MTYVALTLKIKDVSGAYWCLLKLLSLSTYLVLCPVLICEYFKAHYDLCSTVSSVSLNYYRDYVSVLCPVSIYVGASKTIVSNSASPTKITICS
jgi:hypothetical protein